MIRATKAWTGAAVAAFVCATWTGGCSNDDATTTAPASASTAEAGAACTAGAKECVGDRLARVALRSGGEDGRGCVGDLRAAALRRGLDP